jgi:hypothetical protein
MIRIAIFPKSEIALQQQDYGMIKRTVFVYKRTAFAFANECRSFYLFKGALRFQRLKP